MIVPISIGLSVIMVAAERRYRRSGSAEDRAASDFWIKLFTTTFALGVATGITMEFAFGTNWADYSRFVGDIFGAPLAAEGVFAFFLESTFLGVLLFGRTRVSKRFYYVSAWLVAAGAHLSALWIIIANSWQQTPAGFKVEGGRAVLTDFFAAAFNPSTLPRYFHTVASTWVMGGFLAAGIAAWYLLKGREVAFARRAMPVALVVALVASLAMPIIGDTHARQVAATQPAKMAAYEGLFKTTDNAGMTLFGWIDEANKTTVARIQIPGVLGMMVGKGPNRTVTGLDAFKPADIPPLQVTFQSYHLMVALGMLLVLVGALGLVQWKRGKLESSRWLLWALVFSSPLALLAIESGWTAAEVGRQPWIVYGQLRTLDAVSKVVPAWQIATTLAVFAVIYAVLFVGWARVFFGYVKKGPSALAALTPAPATETTSAESLSATPAPATPATAS
jgi:cytochrome d ubiquinol oxidase subunit I